MSDIRRRRGNRFPAVKGNDQIAVYFRSERIEGYVIDESSSGLGAVFPSGCGLRQGQKVQLIFRRIRRKATVAYVGSGEDGERVGLIVEN